MNGALGEHSVWQAANQRYLRASLGVVAAALAQHAARSAAAAGPGQAGAGSAAAAAEEAAAAEAAAAEAAAAQAADLSGPATLDSLVAAFDLSPFERAILLLCAGCELEGGFSALCGRAQGDAGRPYPTFGLALAALPGAHWSALSPNAPLRRWRLVEMAPGHGLAAAPLRIDERVLHYLAGVQYQDERLNGLVAPLPAAGYLAASHAGVAEAAATAWLRAAGGWPLPALEICGDDPAACRAVAAAAAEALGIRLGCLPAGLLPGSPAERDLLARLWEREAVLNGSGVLLDCHDPDQPDAARLAAATGFAERLLPGGLLLLTAGQRQPLGSRPVLAFDVAAPTASEQRRLWQQSLGPAAAGLDARLDVLVSQFNLGPAGIAAACAEAGPAGEPGVADNDDGAPSADPGRAGRSAGDRFAALWSACCRQARPRLDELAQRIEPAATWADLVLPEQQAKTLHEIAAQVRQRAVVYEQWGFAARGTRGLGISALFAGASGTGKTLAAEVLAGELGLDLYRIDLSQVVSKYIGETEKNLRLVFNAAEAGGAVLLFDEADALFGKRSEVKDSHDRYANIEVSYLLQRMEAYRGLAILTTNLREALDPAFTRRLRFIVQFPFPGEEQRAEIWRLVFPPAVPVAGLNVARLAQLNVAGGNIRNIALNAAFLAADAGEAVTMAHLLRAARSEYAKLEKPLMDAELRGWL